MIKQSARQAHHEHEEEIEHLLKQIAQDVRQNSRTFQRQGARDWGFVGDLAHVESLLRQAHNFLNNIDED